MKRRRPHARRGSRWAPIGLVLLLLLAGPGDPTAAEEALTPSEVLARVEGADGEARLELLEQLDEDMLERTLDACMREGSSGWTRSRLSTMLGYKQLNRRAARLRESAPPDEALADAPRFTVLDYPRTDGSTSTIPLERLVVCRLLRSPYVWGGPKEIRLADRPVESPRPSGAPDYFNREKRPPRLQRIARGGIVADAKAPGNERRATIINRLLVKHGGTHDAWVSLIEGKADLIFVARDASPDERKLAQEKGVDVDTVPVARDGFVFLVNKMNPVESMTLEQVRAVYGGELEEWSEVGVALGPIEAFQRNLNSGSQQLFLSLVMKDSAVTVPPSNLLRNSMMGPFNALASRPAGLGYTVWYYERYMAALPDVKPIAIDGVVPTPETIADGSYPLVTTVYAAVRADADPDSGARRLRDWLLTETGQAVVAESGYVPLR